jgi:hypothetical protein
LRQFASSGFRIWNLGREAKVLYTMFALFALAGYATSVLYYEDLTTDGGARGYYTGGPVAAAAEPGPAGGPSIELPEEAARPVHTPISYRHLLEITHFHLFTVPVLLLIVAHLFMLTGLGPATKLAWIVGASVSALVHLAAPWLCRYGGAALVPVVPVSGVAMLGSFGFMTVYAVYAMWRAPGDRHSGSSPP